MTKAQELVRLSGWLSYVFESICSVAHTHTPDEAVEGHLKEIFERVYGRYDDAVTAHNLFKSLSNISLDRGVDDAIHALTSGYAVKGKTD